MKSAALILTAMILAAAVVALTAYPASREPVRASETADGGWEYLVVAGGTTNLSPPGSQSMRKEPGPFSREAFPLEQNLDKLGAKGWELVTVSGSPADPVFYFKRRK